MPAPLERQAEARLHGHLIASSKFILYRAVLVVVSLLGVFSSLACLQQPATLLFILRCIKFSRSSRVAVVEALPSRKLCLRQHRHGRASLFVYLNGCRLHCAAQLPATKQLWLSSIGASKSGHKPQAPLRVWAAHSFCQSKKVPYPALRRLHIMLVCWRYWCCRLLTTGSGSLTLLEVSLGPKSRPALASDFLPL